MATINQIQKGFVRFVGDDLASAFEGWQRALVVGGSTLLAANIPRLVNEYGQNPMISAFGVYNKETGTVDVDNLYKAFVPHLGGDKIPIAIPGIGTIKIGKEEIDILVRYIKEA